MLHVWIGFSGRWWAVLGFHQMWKRFVPRSESLLLISSDQRTCSYVLVCQVSNTGFHFFFLIMAFHLNSSINPKFFCSIQVIVVLWTASSVWTVDLSSSYRVTFGLLFASLIKALLTRSFTLGGLPHLCSVAGVIFFLQCSQALHQWRIIEKESSTQHSV